MSLGLGRVLSCLVILVLTIGASGTSAMYSDKVNPSDVASQMSAQRAGRRAEAERSSAGSDEPSGTYEEASAPADEPTAAAVAQSTPDPRHKRWPWILAGLVAVAAVAAVLFVRNGRDAAVEDGAILVQGQEKKTRRKRQASPVPARR